MMNDLFDDLKDLKSKLKKEENEKTPKQEKKTYSTKELIKQKEDTLKADFLDYMEQSLVKKI